MASGAKKQNEAAAKSNQKKGVAALQYKGYSDPFGSIKDNVFTPIESQDQIDARNTTNSKLNGLISNVPTSYSTADLYDNPFYSGLSGYYNSAIDSQEATDRTNLANNINARGLSGGSYDAYSNSLLNKDYGQRRANAEIQARTGSADAFSQSLNNGLNSITTLRNDATNALSNTYRPLTAGLAYQGAVTPLQTGTANLYGQAASQYLNQALTAPSTFQTVFNNFLKAQESGGRTIGAILGG